MILSDWEIRRLCEAGMVAPFDPALINPASIDVRLGNTLLIESAQSPAMVPYPLGDHSKENPYLLVPGQFALAETVETFNIPTWLCVEFKLKSSRARERYDHAKAGFGDPGWHNSKLTMELKNNSQLWPIPLWPGMLIGQMVFTRMSQEPVRSYAETGRYNNDQSVQESRG